MRFVFLLLAPLCVFAGRSDAATVGFSLTMAESNLSEFPNLFLDNTSTAARIERFEMTIGDPAFGFDAVADFVEAIESPVGSRFGQGTVVEPGVRLDARRSDVLVVEFEPRLSPDGRSGILHPFIAPDDDPSAAVAAGVGFGEWQNIFFDNGADVPNSVVRAFFDNGQSLGFELPETPTRLPNSETLTGIIGGNAYGFFVAESVSEVPLPGAVWLLAPAVAALGVARARRRRNA